MTDNTLPEVGSRWTLAGDPESVLPPNIATVFGTKKRGRGYQVILEYPAIEGNIHVRVLRLADFRKQAKPA